MEPAERTLPTRRHPQGTPVRSTPVVALWAHGRFGYQDVVMLAIPVIGLTLLLLSWWVLPSYFDSAPRQAGTVTVTACTWFGEADNDRYKCTGSFEPDAGETLTPPPHIWVGAGELYAAGEVVRAELFPDDTLRLADENATDPFLGLGVGASVVGVPILLIYLWKTLRYLMLRRSYPGVDVLDRDGWPSGRGITQGSRDVLITRAVANRRGSRLVLLVVLAAIVGVGGVMAWGAVGPGRVAASVTVDGCTDSGDFSGPGLRPLVTCVGATENGTPVEFVSQSRKYLEPGAHATGHVVDGAFVDRSGGLAGEELFPYLIGLVVFAMIAGGVSRANTLQIRRLETMEATPNIVN